MIGYDQLVEAKNADADGRVPLYSGYEELGIDPEALRQFSADYAESNLPEMMAVSQDPHAWVFAALLRGVAIGIRAAIANDLRNRVR